jgi:CRP-like cAMP-binding protein
MRDGKPPARQNLEPGATLIEQGAEGTELYLLLDGVLTAEVDGEEVAEIGPGAVLGERAVLEGGRRTATLRARTRCRVAVVPSDLVDRGSLERLSAGRDEQR